MPKKVKAIEALAIKFVYNSNTKARYQLVLKMTRTYGHKATNRAIANAFDIQKMIDPTLQQG